MTRNTRRLIAPATAVVAALLLGGCRASNNSSEGDLPASSESSPAAAASKSGTGSASAKPSPKPTGAQVVQIGGPDSKDTKETARKEAFETVKQYNRVQDAWGSSEEELKNYSEEDLKKFLDGDALKQMQEAHARMVDNNLGSGKGQVEVGLLEMYNASKIEFNDGKAWEHGLVQLRVCENWSGVHNADGSKSIPDDKAKRTMDTIIERHADGYYYLVSYRVDHYGCD